MPCFNFGRFPCGKCDGCLSSRSSDWSVRLSHELKDHQASSFITLTYEVNPVSVCKRDAQLFLKRLRSLLVPRRIRYYLASEYGGKTFRPHYHAIIFGHDFSKDPGAHEVRRGLFTSPLLLSAWGLGHVSSGTVSDASIRYVTNYILTKDATPSGCEKTFSLMSRRPGLGANWIDAHQAETYRTDSVVVGSFERRPPRYYDNRATCGDTAAKTALKVRRRASVLSRILADESDYLANLAPERREAEAKIFRSQKSMKPGEL